VAGEAASTSNARIQQIASSMGVFGKEAGTASQRLIELAEATALNTGVDQNAIKATQAKLLTFKELAQTAGDVGGAFDRATMAAIDLGAAGFGSAESNAVALGKALNDPIKGIAALTRNGITFTEAEKEKIKTLVESGKTLEAQNMILGAIETQVGGTAEATANASDKMKVAWSQVEEGVGQLLLPVFEKFTTFMIENVFPVVKAFAQDVIAKAQPFIEKFSNYFENDVLPALQDFAKFIMDTIVPNLKKAFMPILEAVKGAFDNIMKAIEDNKPALNDLYELFKTVIGWISANVLPIVGTLVAVAFDNAGKSISFVIGFIGKLITAWKNIIGFFQTGFTTIKETFTKIGDAITKPFKVAFRAVAKFWNDTLGKFKITIPDWVPFIGGQEWGFPKLPVPELANGGIVKARRGGTLALIGEGGRDEAVIPLPKGMRKDGIGGGGITINVSGALDPEAVARQIETILKRSRLRAGAY
jgi:phage-related protein